MSPKRSHARRRQAAPAALAAFLFTLLALAASGPAQAQAPLGFGAIHAFHGLSASGRDSDGTTPYGSLTNGGDGYLYGVAYDGGSSNDGTIFKVRLDGSGFSTLYSFSARSTTTPYTNTDGAFPFGALLPGGDGFLYGTTEDGGANGSGAIFKIQPDGSGFSAIYSFSALNSSSDNADGATPVNGLTSGGDGFFYGAARYGGANGDGTVFQINSDGSVFNAVHSFTAATDGDYPTGGLAAPGDGYLYGTATGGGANSDGAIFRLHTDGTSFLVLHSFSAQSATAPYSNSDGAYPYAGLTAGPGGDLYGTATHGGPNGTGAIFKIAPNGSGFAAIHSFSALNNSNDNADGASPSNSCGVTPGADGLLYGAATYGGANGEGTVFRLATDGSGFQTLHSFSAQSSTNPFGNGDGAIPEGTPIFGPDGFLYGTALYGGSNNAGVLYRIAPVHTRLLWNNADGRASVWTIDTQGNVVVSPTYGPYSGWHAASLSSGPDGLAHLLWTHPADGQAALWDLSASGSPTQYPFGPYASWSAQAVTTGSDNLSRLLWNDSTAPFGQSGNGPLSLWTVDGNGNFNDSFYGPFKGWYGQAVASSADGVTHILWDNVNGQSVLWTVDTINNATVSPVYGPISGWQAISVAVGLAGQRDLLWTHSSDGEASLWRVAGDGTYTFNAYGPYSGFNVAGVAAGPDGVARLLWDSASGVESLWSVNADGTFTTAQYGPFSGWSAVAVSAGP